MLTSARNNKKSLGMSETHKSCHVSLQPWFSISSYKAEHSAKRAWKLFTLKAEKTNLRQKTPFSINQAMIEEMLAGGDAQTYDTKSQVENIVQFYCAALEELKYFSYY